MVEQGYDLNGIELLHEGLKHLRKLRTAVTDHKVKKSEKVVAWNSAKELLVTMETIILYNKSNRTELADNLMRILRYELYLSYQFSSYEEASIYGRDGAAASIATTDLMAAVVTKDYTSALRSLLLRNRQENVDPSLLLTPKTLVVSPLSSDRLMLGVLQRGIRCRNNPCFDLATVAISSDAHTVAYPPDELKKFNVAGRKNIVVLCDAVVNGLTAEAIHNDLKRRTRATILSGVENSSRREKN